MLWFLKKYGDVQELTTPALLRTGSLLCPALCCRGHAVALGKIVPHSPKHAHKETHHIVARAAGRTHKAFGSQPLNCRGSLIGATESCEMSLFCLASSSCACVSIRPVSSHPPRHPRGKHPEPADPTLVFGIMQPPILMRDARPPDLEVGAQPQRAEICSGSVAERSREEAKTDFPRGKCRSRCNSGRATVFSRKTENFSEPVPMPEPPKSLSSNWRNCQRWRVEFGGGGTGAGQGRGSSCGFAWLRCRHGLRVVLSFAREYGITTTVLLFFLRLIR